MQALFKPFFKKITLLEFFKVKFGKISVKSFKKSNPIVFGMVGKSSFFRQTWVQYLTCIWAVSDTFPNWIRGYVHPRKDKRVSNNSGFKLLWIEGGIFLLPTIMLEGFW